MLNLVFGVVLQGFGVSKLAFELRSMLTSCKRQEFRACSLRIACREPSERSAPACNKSHPLATPSLVPERHSRSYVGFLKHAKTRPILKGFPPSCAPESSAQIQGLLTPVTPCKPCQPYKPYKPCTKRPSAQIVVCGSWYPNALF